MSSQDRKSGNGRSVAALAALFAFSMTVAGCGRSGPEGAAAVIPDGPEPASAGVQIISENPVVATTPTSSTVATTPPSTTVAPSPAGSYVVEPGDTLSVIAEQFGVSVAAISEANGIEDVNSIRPGQELIIPGS